MGEAISAIADVGVDLPALVDLADSIFDGRPAIAFTEFLEIVLQLRGSNQVTVRDIVDLKKFLLQEFTIVEENLIARIDAPGQVAQNDQSNMRRSKIFASGLPATNSQLPMVHVGTI